MASDSDNCGLNCAFRFRVIIMRLLQIWCRQAFFFLSPWMVQCPSQLNMYLCSGFSALNFSQLQSMQIGKSMSSTLDHLFYPYSAPPAFWLILHESNSFYTPHSTHVPSLAAPYPFFNSQPNYCLLLRFFFSIFILKTIHGIHAPFFLLGPFVILYYLWMYYSLLNLWFLIFNHIFIQGMAKISLQFSLTFILHNTNLNSCDIMVNNIFKNLVFNQVQ